MSNETGIKTYVLDTNILLQTPYSLFAFDEHEVVIPDIVIEELDKNKTRNGEVGANAREVIRALEALRSTSTKNKLTEGVQIPNGGSIRVETDARDNGNIDGEWDRTTPDFRILQVAAGLTAKSKNPVILVTNDISLRIKADICGIHCEGYRSDNAKEEETEQYTGRRTISVTKDVIDRFYELSKGLERKDEPFAANLLFGEGEYDFIENEFITLSCEQSNTGAVMMYRQGIFYPSGEINKSEVYGVRPKNAGQTFAIQALMAYPDSIPLVILQGAAGTAKTFLSLACGLERVLGNETVYRKILVVRPNVKFDDTIGFLKGSEEEKIGPLMRPIMDNLDQLTANKTNMGGYESPRYKDKFSNGGYYREEEHGSMAAPNYFVQEMFDKGFIVAQAMEYMRGRSITDTYIIIDEAQNMTPLQAFGIISRAGTGSKIVIVGDPDQIDNPQLDARNNGLTFAASRMKGSQYCAQITFAEKECVRSVLAKEAISRMSVKGKV